MATRKASVKTATTTTTVKKNRINKTPSKDYVGGVDGGAGGVGFGVPDDYVGGRPNQNLSVEDAPQITDDGVIKSDDNVSHELLENLPPMSAIPLESTPPYTYNVTPVDNDGEVTLDIDTDGIDAVNVDSPEPTVTQKPVEQDSSVRTTFYESYSRLDQSNPIRTRAEKIDITFANTIKQCEEFSQRIDVQKELAAKTLESIKYIIGEIIRVKNEEPTFERLEKIYSQWIMPLANLYQEANFKFDDVCPFVSNALEKLHAIPQDSQVIPTALDEIVGILDEAMTHLMQVKDEGYGNTLLDYYNCLSQQDAAMSEVERMAKDVEKALKANGRNTFGRSMMGEVNKAVKQNYRLLENIQKQHEPAQKEEPLVPDDVPNYRLAIDESPRVCGNCRFFQGAEGVNGGCSAFNFTAKANYVCDAWQSPNLTPVHTTVRSINNIEETIMKDSRTKADGDYPLHAKTPVEYVNRHAEPLQGVVEQTNLDDRHVGDLVYPVEVDRSYNEPEIPDDNAAINDAVRTAFLPGDTIYSKSLNSLGVIQGSVVLDGIKMYSIKLINNQGMASGSGYTYGSDLIARSNQATKEAVKADTLKTNPFSMKSVAVKSESDDPALDQMVEVTRSIYKALKAVCDSHADVVSVPLSNKDVLTPLHNDMLKTLENPIFQGVSTGAKRKYYRAIQTALVSIGAARLVLFEGYKTMKYLKVNGGATSKADMQSTMVKAQTDAYDRVKYAYGQIKDALTLPSATHGMEAPGIGDGSSED